MLSFILHGGFRLLGQEYKEVAKSMFNKRSDTGKNINRKSHSDFQDKINGLYSNIKLFEKGIKFFDGKYYSTSNVFLFILWLWFRHFIEV